MTGRYKSQWPDEVLSDLVRRAEMLRARGLTYREVAARLSESPNLHPKPSGPTVHAWLTGGTVKGLRMRARGGAG